VKPTNSGERTASRRSFTRALGGTLVSGWPARLQGTSQIGAPELDGNLHFDEATVRAYAQDYGHIVHKRPLAALQPGSVEDVVRIVQFARARGLLVVPRGEGHQPYGQAQVRGGVVIDMRSLCEVHEVTADCMTIDAGAQWRTAMYAALEVGRALPVLPAFLGLTVGGTLSVGGVGTASLRHGAQVDQVRELQLVTGEGSLVTCSERERADLFEAALAGQGQCGIITRAVLRVATAQPLIREHIFRYTDLSTLLHDQATLLHDPYVDGLVAMVIPGPGGWAFMLTALRQHNGAETLTDRDWPTSLHAKAEQPRDVPYAQYTDATPPMSIGASHADLGLMAPGNEVAPMLSELLPRLNPEDLGAVNAIRLFLWKRSSFTRPLLRLPDTDPVAYLAFLRTETRDPGTLARQLTGNRTLFERTRERGGTFYGYSALQLTSRDWQGHYGPAWRPLRDAKRRYDPDRVLAFSSGPFP
jgi:cytokinin dehydrogenase